MELKRSVRLEQGRVRCALSLAGAEAAAQRLDWSFEWAPEMLGYDEFLGDHEYWCDDAKNGIEHDHEVFYCTLDTPDGEMLQSLGGIIDPSEAYRRVIEAELASEALHELRKADPFWDVPEPQGVL